LTAQDIQALRVQKDEADLAASHAAAAASKTIEGLQAHLIKVQEHASRGAEAAVQAHEGVVQGLQDMLAQSEADYSLLKANNEVLEVQVCEVQRMVEALKEAASETEFQMERQRNRLEEEVDKAKTDLSRAEQEQDVLMTKVVDVEEELDTVKNDRQELVLQVQELQDDNDELNALVKKASGVGNNKRMSVYTGGVKAEGSFDARRQVWCPPLLHPCHGVGACLFAGIGVLLFVGAAGAPYQLAVEHAQTSGCSMPATGT